MRITILGSGSAYGTPYATDVWNDAVDKNNKKNYRTRSSIYLEDDDNKKLLVECGPDFRQQTITHNIKDFDDIFISHGHTDHMMGVWELTKLAKIRGKTINLYGNRECMKIVNTRFPWIFEDREEEVGKGSVKLNQIVEFKNYTIANMDIMPLKFSHDDTISLGFKYKNFVFSPDAEFIQEASEQHMKNLDLWIMECNNIRYRDNGHTHLELALERIDKYKPKRAILTHLSYEFDYDTISKQLPENVELAYDGMVVDCGN